MSREVKLDPTDTLSQEPTVNGALRSAAACLYRTVDEIAAWLKDPGAAVARDTPEYTRTSSFLLNKADIHLRCARAGLAMLSFSEPTIAQGLLDAHWALAHIDQELHGMSVAPGPAVIEQLGKLLSHYVRCIDEKRIRLPADSAALPEAGPADHGVWAARDPVCQMRDRGGQADPTAADEIVEAYVMRR